MIKHSHKCQNAQCTNISIKDKYGNYKRYCSDNCMKIGRAIKFNNTYKDKDKDAILTKRKATVQEKYGVDNVAQSDNVRAQLKITTTATATVRTQKTKLNNLEKYGVESTNSLPEIKDKKKKSFLEKYGVDHQLKIPSVAAKVADANTKNANERLAKAKETNLEKFGFENPSSNDSVKARRTETMIERFGVENASQNAEIHEKKVKNGYKSKKYVMPSGSIIFVQGYEPKALDELLAIYDESEIIVKTELKPRIPYIGKDNKSHYYFPDFYIPKDNLIVEVKSEWTYTQNKTICDIKRDATIAAGYSYRFMIY